MKVDVLDIEQRSDEWFTARLGRATGSKAAAILAKGRGNAESVTKRDYRIQLALERITGRRIDEGGFVSNEMRRGTEMEPAAMAAYEAHTGRIAMPVGFYQCCDLMAGCSPDGVVDGGTRLLSLKAPKSSTHLGYLRDGGMPAEYVPQMLHEMWLTGAVLYDFVSYDDRMPEDLQLFLVTVERDDAAVNDYATAATAFLKEVDAEVKAIESLRRKAA